MSAITDEDLPQLLCHRDELDRLRPLIADDLGDARAELSAAMKEAQRLEQAAEDYLTDIEERYRDEDDPTDDGDLRDAKEWLEECRRYSDEISEIVAQARGRLNDLEEKIESSLRVAAASLDGVLEKYAAYKAIDRDTNYVARGGVRGAAGGAAGQGGVTGQALPQPTLPKGYTWVPLSSLNWSEVPAGLAFSKAAHEDIRTMLEVFDQKLLPLMRANPAITRDDLHRLDMAAGRLTPGQQARSLTFAWDCMFGTDPIALSQGGAGSCFGWTSGRHRAVVARGLGWSHLPARIV